MRRSFSGLVRKGLARGRKLGFPTANLQVDGAVESDLEKGVFVGRVSWEQETSSALINIGVRPTFSEGVLSTELHLLDFTGNLYGKRLNVEIIAKLRDEHKFEHVDELIEQIGKDLKQARAVLEGRTAEITNTEDGKCR